MVPILILAANPAGGWATPGLPVLTTQNNYRITDENVQLNVSKDGTVEVSSTTVYRNLGGPINANLYLPGFPVQLSKETRSASITWDKQPVTILLNQTSASSVPAPMAQVMLGDQATHALRIHFFTKLAPTGYGQDEYKFQYGLNGNHPIDLLSLAYRYRPDSIFGLPTAKPDLGWEIGEKGASIRKENFQPDNALTEIQFYWISVKPLGG